MEFRSWTYRTFCVILGTLLWFPIHIKGQNETHEAKVTPANFYSPGYVFNLDYGPNVTYDYLVETKYPNHTVMLSMKDCEIESDKNGHCYYDTLEIYDGVNETAPLIDTFCCNGSPLLPVWYTSGPFVYLVFTTDKSNNYKGFKMEFASFGTTTTTSTTTTSTTSLTTSTTTSTPTTTSITSTTSTATPTTTSTSTTPTTTTTSTVTTSTSPITTGTSTTVSSGSTQTPMSGGDSDDSNSNIWIIIGAVIGGVLIVIIIVVIVVCLIKKSKRPRSSDSRVTKRVLWSRNGTTLVHPVDFKKEEGPPGTIVQTNIFDMDLPVSGGKGNLLPPITPPLRSVLYPQPPSKQATIADIFPEEKNPF